MSHPVDLAIDGLLEKLDTEALEGFVELAPAPIPEEDAAARAYEQLLRMPLYAEASPETLETLRQICRESEGCKP